MKPKVILLIGALFFLSACAPKVATNCPPTREGRWVNVGSYGFFAVNDLLIGSVIVIDDGRAMVFEPLRNSITYHQPGTEFSVDWGLVERYYIDCSGNLWVDMNSTREQPVVPPGMIG